MARTLKGRYFKHTDIMDAHLGSKQSYVWRSLVWGKDLLRKGLCWRVGNGRNILAHHDAWIPGIPQCKSVVSLHPERYRKVDSYISVSGAWNEQAVRANFIPFEAEAILNIPLTRRDREDSRFWTSSTDGKYSVKEGYIMELGGAIPPGNQSNHPYTSWWKFIWKLRIPPKVRIFLWRASRNFIPAAANLLSHHVPSNGLCVLCQKFMAKTSHVLLFCPLVRYVWENMSYWSDLKKRRSLSFIDLAFELSRIIKQDEFELFVSLCWAVWNDYCKKVYDAGRRLTVMCFDWVGAMLESFRKSNVVRNLEEQQHNSQVQLWQATPSNQFRMDVDAGYDIIGGKFSTGVIIRDAHNLVWGAASRVIRNPGSVKGAELTAIKIGMELCLQIGLSGIHIFSDSALAVKAINTPANEFGPDGILALEIRDLWHSNVFISINHMKRDANRVAHSLAKKALDSSLSVDWPKGDIPEWLNIIVSRDNLA